MSLICQDVRLTAGALQVTGFGEVCVFVQKAFINTHHPPHFLFFRYGNTGLVLQVIVN